MAADGAIQDTLFTHAKAGMDDVDREKIKRLVYEYSKGSAFLAEQERRDRRVAQQIEEQRRRLERLHRCGHTPNCDWLHMTYSSCFHCI